MKFYYSYHIIFLITICFGVNVTAQLEVGAAQNKISPKNKAYIAGHTHNRIFSGINDDIYVKAAVIKNDNNILTILTFDCIGLLYPQLLEIRKATQKRLPSYPINQIVMSSTHTHSGPDVVGLWGPDAITSGVDSSYMNFVIEQATDAIVEAYNNIQLVSGQYGQGLHGADWVFNISEATEIDRSLNVLQFINDQNEKILTLTNFACHPTFLDASNDQVSADYIGGYYEQLDSIYGGINMFLQGAIGGWVQPEYEAHTTEQAFYRGSELAEDVNQLMHNAQALESDEIKFASTIIQLPVENPNFKLLSDLGVIDRHFGDSVLTELAYFTIGEASFATHPGETVPQLSIATKNMMCKNGPKFIMGLGMDALGYILKPSFFDTTLQIPHSKYLCSVSLGSKTQDLILKHLESLIKTNCNVKTQLESEFDKIIQEGIDSMAFPGCQIAVSYKGELILHKSYGYHTYDKIVEVKNRDLYDLASLTKVTTGLALLMKLQDKGMFDLDAPLSRYLPLLRKTNKSNITFREVLTHQAKLLPYIVFWQNTIKKNGKFKARTFKSRQNKRFPIKITNELYLHKKYKQKMFKAIAKSELLDDKAYRYSGLFFLILPDLVESITGVDYSQLLRVQLFDPLGLSTMGYHPSDRFSKNRIVPTEIDTLFRDQLVHGTVHDEAAAMLDGISANAGLFSNALDLNRLFQLYSNMGIIDGKRYFSSQTTREYTSYQYDGNRRGLGFDKPLLEYDKDKSYVAKSASASSFGHSGFTGTMAWADPEHDIVFVFLSNRVYPYRSQRMIYDMNIRPRLHQSIYNILMNKD